MNTPHNPDLARRLARELRGEVLTSHFDLGRYATDASFYQIMPLCVAVPKDMADVEAAVGICCELGIPLLPRGGGTSQSGQTVNRALVLDFSKYLNHILPMAENVDTHLFWEKKQKIQDTHLSGRLKVDTHLARQELSPEFLEEIMDTHRIRVQPGVVLDQLNNALKPTGLWFPVDVSTASRATIGGMAANNSCGSRSIRYGAMRHNVNAIHGLMADSSRARFGEYRPGVDSFPGNPRMSRLATELIALGEREKNEIRQRFPDLTRRVGGYNIDALVNNHEPVNLAHLLVGSEGTLAVSESIELKLEPRLANKALGVCHFPSFHDAMANTQHIVALDPVAVELVDHNMIQLCRDIPLFRPVIERFVKGEPQALLLVEFAQPDQAENLRRLKQLTELMTDLGFSWDASNRHSGGVVEVVDTESQNAIWEVRKQGLNIMMSMKSEGKPVSFVEDCAVRLEDLADYTQRLTEIFTRHGTQGTWYAHASVGTLHVRPVLNLKLDEDVRKMRTIAEETFEMVHEYRGSHSGEHGDGIVRSEFHECMYGPRIIHSFEQVKDVFDPTGILNPGKIVRPSKMDDRSLMRYPPGYRVPDIETKLDWSGWTGAGGGFQGAIEMCNNNGACRKLDDGVMCPSYRVTRNERDLVRGRANSLRLAISGQLGENALTSEEMMQTMKLCVSCKACRRECPTGVDMARMKIEVLAARAEQHGISLHDRLIGYLPWYAPWMSRAPWLANLRNRIPALARWSENITGFSAQRQLPNWRSDYFRDRELGPAAAKPDVVLLADSFNRYFEPENLRAAGDVLTAAGYTVMAATSPDSRPLCCGRTFLSAGLVERARAEARRTLKALLPHAQNGATIVGLEPSCTLGLRDEYLNLLPGEDSRYLAGRVKMLEEFIDEQMQAGRFSLKLKSIGKKALLHGHCHQKAFDAMGAVSRVLGMVPGLAVESIQSSCCGMAGAFGYHVDTIETSKAMAELSLLPTIREAEIDTLVVADGTSCREQIADGAEVRPLHVARVLQQALAGS